MDIKTNICVTYVSQYALENNGPKGLTVNYFMLDERNKIGNDLIGPTLGAQGDQSAKANALSYDDKSKFLRVPGIYEGSFVMTTGSDRKPVLKLVDVKYLCPANVFPCSIDGKPLLTIPTAEEVKK